jgi:hypothetical protein
MFYLSSFFGYLFNIYIYDVIESFSQFSPELWNVIDFLFKKIKIAAP